MRSYFEIFHGVGHGGDVISKLWPLVMAAAWETVEAIDEMCGLKQNKWKGGS